MARFYLPGRINYSELSGAHKAVMAGIVGALRLELRKSGNERNMIDTAERTSTGLTLRALIRRGLSCSTLCVLSAGCSDPN